MRKALVCGAGGFIGGHLVKRLKQEGLWVRGADIVAQRFSPSAADDFMLGDLRDRDFCAEAVSAPGGFDEVYQLAADMGGMGFIRSAQCEIMRNNALINLNMVDAAAEARVPRYFYASSVCVYRDMKPDEPELTEEDAYPAHPDNEYGWEKLYSERVLQAYGDRYGFAARIARFQNCYGPEGTWEGGREKAPAAIARKVAEAEEGGSIEVWGDGSAVRCFIFVSDLVEAVIKLTRSDVNRPVNIGTREYVTIADLVKMTIEISNKSVNVNWVEGPVGVQVRNFSNDLVEALPWKPQVSTEEGMRIVYPWVEQQMNVRQQAQHQPV